jgi:hypothetical protein
MCGTRRGTSWFLPAARTALHLLPDLHLQFFVEVRLQLQRILAVRRDRRRRVVWVRRLRQRPR